MTEREIAENLKEDSYELEQAVRQLDSVKSMLTSSWEGEAASSFTVKLSSLIQEIDYARRQMDSISRKF